MKKAFIFMLSVLVLGVSCSTVFTGGLSGVVVSADLDSEPAIGGVRVYAYLDPQKRDSDFDSWTRGSDFSPSSSLYVPSTTTAADGSFTISKLVWESLFPAFGRTADVAKAYLLFFHKDYGLVKGDSPVTLVSDSNNSSSVRQKLSSIVDHTNLSISIRSCATEGLLATSMGLKVQVFRSCDDPDPQWSWEGSVTGNATVSVPYDRDSQSHCVRIYASRGGSDWALVDPDNSFRRTPFYSYSQALGNTEGRDVEALISGSDYQVELYMKPYTFALPEFSGTVFTSAPVPPSTVPASSESDEGISLWLCRKNGSAIEVYDYEGCTSVTRRSGDGANWARIIYGQFTGLGNNLIEWTVGDYDGKTASTSVLIVADSNRSGAIEDEDQALAVKVKSYDTGTMEGLVLSVDKTVASQSALL